MSDMATVDELNARFAQPPDSRLEPDVLGELQSIMRLHSIDPQELFYKWESYSMKMGADDMRLNIETARALKKDIQDGLERENRAKVHVRNAEKRGVATPRNVNNAGDMFGMIDGILPNTPKPGSARTNGTAKRRAAPYETPSISKTKAEPMSSPLGLGTSNQSGSKQNVFSAPATSFNDRPDPGVTLSYFNEHLALPDPPIAPYGEARIKLTANAEMKKLSYKPMAMKTSEASEVLDDRIDEFMLLIREEHKLDYSAFGSAAARSTNEIVAVGRIASDSLEGKLNPASLVLESSRRMGAGLRNPLKMGSISHYQFFPGQIVALRGINTSGHEFVASEILEPPLLPVAAASPETLDGYKQKLRGGPDAMDSDTEPAPLSILVASGPYTADDNLDFEPLHALCSQAADSYADALILTGPFLDIDHPLVATGDFDLPDEALKEPDTATLSTVFKYLISPIFHRLANAVPHITILLIPSVRDALSAHVSWPQEPFPRKALALPKAVKIVGNPMTISLNEMIAGITSQDILYQLKQSETVSRPKLDWEARLSRYLIEQRSYFPLFPSMDRSALQRTGTEEGLATGAMLDVGYGKLGEMLNVRPDLLVVPSTMPPFVKIVENVLVVNPGLLSKRKAAGTYARLTIHARELSDEEKSQKKDVANNLFERARVDIIRI